MNCVAGIPDFDAWRADGGHRTDAAPGELNARRNVYRHYEQRPAVPHQPIARTHPARTSAEAMKTGAIRSLNPSCPCGAAVYMNHGATRMSVFIEASYSKIC